MSALSGTGSQHSSPISECTGGVRSQPELVFPIASCCGYFPSAASGELWMSGTWQGTGQGAGIAQKTQLSEGALELAAKANLVRSWLSFWLPCGPEESRLQPSE